MIELEERLPDQGEELNIENIDIFGEATPLDDLKNFRIKKEQSIHLPVRIPINRQFIKHQQGKL